MVKNFFTLSLVVIISSCSIFNTKELNNTLSAEFKSLNMWFDASPKVDSDSYFHALMELEMVNESNENIYVDSILCEFDFGGFKKTVSVSSDGFVDEIKSLEKKSIKDQIKFIPDKTIQESRELNLNLLIYYKKSGKEYINRYPYPKLRFEIVY